LFRLFVEIISKQTDIAQVSLKIRAVSSEAYPISFPNFDVQALDFQFFIFLIEVKGFVTF